MSDSVLPSLSMESALKVPAAEAGARWYRRKMAEIVMTEAAIRNLVFIIGSPSLCRPLPLMIAWNPGLFHYHRQTKTLCPFPLRRQGFQREGNRETGD